MSSAAWARISSSGPATTRLAFSADLFRVLHPPLSADGENIQIEMAHQQKLDIERRDKQQLVEQLKAKEREYQRALSSMHTDKSFRQIEVESSGGRGASSAASRRTYTRHHPPSSAHGPRASSSSQNQLRGPSVAPESPTANRRVPPQATRGTRASTEQPAGGRTGPPPPPTGPRFANFQNSFAPAPSLAKRGEPVLAPPPAAASESEREGSMGPPQMPVGAGTGAAAGEGKATAKKRHAPETPPPAIPAAKRRRDGDVTGSASPKRIPSPRTNGGSGDSVDGSAVRPTAGEVRGVDAGGQGEELPEDDEAWPWVWVAEDKDTRAELLAAVFTHITLGTVDVTPAVVQNPHGGTQAVPGRTGLTMRSSAARSGGVGATATARTSARQRTLGRPLSAKATPAVAASDPPSVASQPTIYALTSMRFLPSTAPNLVSRYEELSRDLFALLGHRPPVASRSSAYGVRSDTAQRVCELVCRQDPEAGFLAFNLATIFASMLHVLEAATMTGPVTALLKLVSHLAFLCPTFAMACCGAEAAGDTPIPATSTQKKAAASSFVAAPRALISLVGHVVARYCRPVAPDPDALSATGRNVLVGSAVVRTRRPRVTRSLGGRRTSSTANMNGVGGKKGNSDPPRVVDLDPAKRIELTAAALALLENVAWRCLAIQPPSSTALVPNVDMKAELAEDA